MSLRFRIDQVAFSAMTFPKRAPLTALQRENQRCVEYLHKLLGLRDDSAVFDEVSATGAVYGQKGKENVAKLNFAYHDITQPLELESLNYTSGENFLAIPKMRRDGEGLASHIAMHCSMEELAEYRAELSANGFLVIQEVWTTNHNNAFLRECGRKYHYVIFSTRRYIGFDLKFIVRIEADASNCD